MSYKADQYSLNQFIGQRLLEVEVHQCDQDEATSSVTLTFEGGEVTLGSRGFSDGSSCLNVDAD